MFDCPECGIVVESVPWGSAQARGMADSSMWTPLIRGDLYERDHERYRYEIKMISLEVEMANLALRGLSQEMYRTLKRAAERNHRSMNGEILARLEASFRPAGADVEIVLSRVAARTAAVALPDLGGDLLSALKDAGRP